MLFSLCDIGKITTNSPVVVYNVIRGNGGFKMRNFSPFIIRVCERPLTVPVDSDLRLASKGWRLLRLHIRDVHAYLIRTTVKPTPLFRIRSELLTIVYNVQYQKGQTTRQPQR